MSQQPDDMATSTPQTAVANEQARLRRQRRDRTLELLSVILMAAAALTTAWCAYQSTYWGTTMTIRFSQATTRRVLGTRATTSAGQLTALDVNLFTNWLNAYAAENTELSKFYEDRFRPEFQPAFQAWVATAPRHNPDAPKSPFAMPEYKVSQTEEADRLDKEAVALFDEGLAANSRRDGYALMTVLLASVLFFVGMAQRMSWFAMRVAMVAIGAGILLLALAKLATLTFT